MCPVRSFTSVTGCTAFHHPHHRPTRPDVTGPPTRFPIFLPTPPIRRPEPEGTKPPPRRPTQASWPTPPVNEKTRLDFEAGLELRGWAG